MSCRELQVSLQSSFTEGPFRAMQNVVCFAKKIVNRKPFLEPTIFFHLPKFSLLHCQCHQTKKVGTPTSFCQVTKPFVLSQLHQCTFLFHKRDQPFLDTRNLPYASSVNNVTKTKKLVTTKCSMFFVNTKLYILSYSLRSRRLEVVGERENWRTQGRHARGEEAPARKAPENCFNSHSVSADISNWSRGSRGKN